jgi:hypothetical protein
MVCFSLKPFALNPFLALFCGRFAIPYPLTTPPSVYRIASTIAWVKRACLSASWTDEIGVLLFTTLS